MEKWISFPQLSPSNPLGGHPHSHWRPAQGLGATTITDTMGMTRASAYRVLGEWGRQPRSTPSADGLSEPNDSRLLSQVSHLLDLEPCWLLLGLSPSERCLATKHEC